MANDAGADLLEDPGRGLGQGSGDVQLGAEPVGVARTPPAVAAGGPPLVPLRWGVTSARGVNSCSAEALAPAVAVICGGGPITRGELPEHAVAPAALVDAVLAAVGV